MFYKTIIKNGDGDFYHSIIKDCIFENIAKGRKGANLTSEKNPIVRTTTSYSLPNQRLTPTCYHIIDKIKTAFPLLDIEFNNALVEIYDHQYRTMKYHSDQVLDLEEKSFIGIFSCYSNPTTTSIRTLRVQEKNSTKCFDIALEHNSVVLFSTTTNSNYLHKIILEISKNHHHHYHHHDDLWLGVTFRQSKTFIYFKDELPFFSHNHQPLTLADSEQQKEFYKNRKFENKNIMYTCPEINYTISIGDLLPIIEKNKHIKQTH